MVVVAFHRPGRICPREDLAEGLHHLCMDLVDIELVVVVVDHDHHREPCSEEEEEVFAGMDFVLGCLHIWAAA